MYPFGYHAYPLTPRETLLLQQQRALEVGRAQGYVAAIRDVVGADRFAALNEAIGKRDAEANRRRREVEDRNTRRDEQLARLLPASSTYTPSSNNRSRRPSSRARTTTTATRKLDSNLDYRNSSDIRADQRKTADGTVITQDAHEKYLRHKAKASEFSKALAKGPGPTDAGSEAKRSSRSYRRSKEDRERDKKSTVYPHDSVSNAMLRSSRRESKSLKSGRDRRRSKATGPESLRGVFARWNSVAKGARVASSTVTLARLSLLRAHSELDPSATRIRFHPLNSNESAVR